MKHIEEEAGFARGFVAPSLMNVSDGRMAPFGMRHNTLSFMSAEAMAAAFGGDPSYIPSRVGFIYGDAEVMPTELDAISRDQSWDSLLEELASSDPEANVGIQVVGFSYSPTLGGADVGGDSSSSSSPSGGGSEDYCHILSTGSNAITFHAVSNSQDPGVVSGSGVFEGGRYVYQAVLLGYHGGKYYIISRVSLKGDEGYLTKPTGFEIALDWTVAFK